MKISFLGAAREVTGSCHVIDTAGARFLVDYGMYQGGRETSARNPKPFASDPPTLDLLAVMRPDSAHLQVRPVIDLVRDQCRQGRARKTRAWTPRHWALAR